jgi:hypothetical protein
VTKKNFPNNPFRRFFDHIGTAIVTKHHPTLPFNPVVERPSSGGSDLSTSSNESHHQDPSQMALLEIVTVVADYIGPIIEGWAIKVYVPSPFCRSWPMSSSSLIKISYTSSNKFKLRLGLNLENKTCDGSNDGGIYVTTNTGHSESDSDLTDAPLISFEVFFVSGILFAYNLDPLLTYLCNRQSLAMQVVS